MEEKMAEFVQKYMIEKGIENPEDLKEDDFQNIMEMILESNDEEILKDFQTYDEMMNNNPKLDKAYEKLDKAYQAKDKKKAIKLAQEAYAISNECFDAILLQFELEDNLALREKILNDGLKNEEKRLKKEGYFTDDSIGIFYGIWETRPYIRGLYRKATFYADSGKLNLAKDVCLEILRLNENDNTGARYILMAIYACLEDEKALVNLTKKYKEENLSTLFPMMVLYYKLGKDEKAISYLKKIKENNPNFVDYFKDGLDEEENVPDGYYSLGGASEVIMYMNNYEFLVYSLEYLPEFVLQN